MSTHDRVEVHESLRRLGWNDHFAHRCRPYLADGLTPGRIAVEHRDAYVVLTALGEIKASLSGRFRYEAGSRADLPAVGDWVVLEAMSPGEGTVRAVLERRSKFVRNVAGERVEEQVVAANIDVSFLVAPLDGPVNLRRLERYMTMAWGGGTDPVIVLTKADLSDDVAGAVAEVEAAVPGGLPIYAVDALGGAGVDALLSHLTGARTGALLGSSGVGKSTLVNALVGAERQRIREVRWDHKGRHTTTVRELIVLPHDGLLIDTPGMREIQLWDAGEGLDDTFEDIVSLGAGCRFSDCTHRTEPGCEVRVALERGELDPGRWQSYVKLQKELAYLERKRDARARAEQTKKWRSISKSMRKTAKR